MADHKEMFAAARQDGRATLDESSCKRILSDFGIAVPANAIAATTAEVAAAAGTLNAPLVVKAISRDVVHKSEFGAVRVNLADASAAQTAAAEIDDNLQTRGVSAEAYLVEEMAPAGKELVVGGVIDPYFGPTVMVGLGGIFVEIFKDVSFRLCPIDAVEAAAMIDELRAAPILAGARGKAGVDRQKLIDVLLAVGGKGGLLETLQDDITELDINPLIASEGAAVAADARIVLAPETKTDRKVVMPLSDEAAREYFEPLFAPRTIGVLGASSKGTSRANGFITQMQNFGYEGPIYPIHPSAEEINGLKAYPSLADTPEPVDYAYVAIPAASVTDSIAASKGRVRFAQVLASGFGEIEGGQELQDDLVKTAHDVGARILGPNCIGAYSPRGRLTFTNGAPEEPGPVGIISQSGGLAADMVRRGKERGLRFSGLVALGNCADIGPADLLEYYLADENTGVAGMYLESLQEGRRFFDMLRRADAKKPIVILKGGRTSLGHKMAVSHTGALSSDSRIWEALARQTGAVLVDDLDQFLDVLLGFQMYRPRRTNTPTTKAALFGNGGGASVLAVDTFAERGVEIAPFRDAALKELQALNLPVGASFSNPVDVPVGSLVKAEGSVVDNVIRVVEEFEGDDIGALVLHLNLPIFWSHVIKTNQDFIKNTLEAIRAAREKYDDPVHYMLVFRSDGRADIEEKKREYLKAALSYNIPVFNELSNAATALSAISKYERFKARR